MRPGMKLASCRMPPLWGMGDWVWDREQAIDELHQRTQVATRLRGQQQEEEKGCEEADWRTMRAQAI